MSRKIIRGSTSQSWFVKFLDTDGNLVTGKTHSDITSMGFRRYNGGREVTEITSTTPATLASKATAYSAGGFVEDADSPGRYRYDPVNAAFETGVDSADNVEPILSCSGVSSIVFERVWLIDFDPFATAERQLEDDAIQAGKFDESTAFPLKQDDSGNTSVLRRGTSDIDATDLKTQNDLAQDDLDDITDNGVALAVTQPNYAPAKAGDAMTLSSAERIAVAAAIEAAIMNDGDSNAVLAAIVAAIDAADIDVITATVIAAEVKAQLDAAHGAGSWESADVSDLPTNSEFNSRTLLSSEYGTSANQVSLAASITALPASVWNHLTTAITTSGSIGKHIIDQFTSVLSSIAGIGGGGGSGTGPLDVKVIVKDADDNLLEKVNLKATLSGAKYTGLTNASGERDFGLEDTGTYRFAVSRESFDLTSATSDATGSLTINPDSVSFNASILIDQEITVVLTTNAGTSSSPESVSALGSVRNKGAAYPGAVVYFEVETLPTGSGIIEFNDSFEVIADGSGVIRPTLLKGATYKYWMVVNGERLRTKKVTISSDAVDGVILETYIVKQA